MAERDPADLETIARSVSDWRKVSDHLFKVGPLKVGLDGILTWIPGVGDVYGLGASAFLLAQAARAGASSETIVKMALLLGVDAAVGSIPVAGDIFDLVFRAHARSARVLLRDIRGKQAEMPRSLPVPTRPIAPEPVPPAPPRPEPEPPAWSESDEWEQSRRVEELRAQAKARGGSIQRPRP